MVELNGNQLQAIVRFNRTYSIKRITIENDEAKDLVLVKATLNTRSEKVKAFYLNGEGSLAGVVDENSTSVT